MPPVAVDAYDVAIVLGAALRPDGSPSPALSRRVGQGVRMVQSGTAGALLMTGGPTTSELPEARVMRALALAAGVPPSRLHTEERSLNTIQNALFTAPLIRQHGWCRLAVVTDAFHRPRTAYIFRRFGLAVTVVGVRPEAPSAQWWLAHLREAAALPWTVARVEARLLRGGP